ncbi:MAG: nucleoside 2-deoxyribosyltransferase [Methanosarcinaceae archaeon]
MVPQHNDYCKRSRFLGQYQIFKRDISEIQKSDIVVFIMDGRVPDDGACVEIGYAYAMGKECICLKTDPRTLMSDLDNPMILGALKDRIARNFKELDDFLIPHRNRA